MLGYDRVKKNPKTPQFYFHWQINIERIVLGFGSP